MVGKIIIKRRQGLTLIEILIITALLTLITSLVINMKISFAKNSRNLEKKSLFERDSTILFQYLQNDLRSLYRADLSQNNLNLYIRRLNSLGFPEEFGVNYQWNQKQVIRTPEDGKVSTFDMIPSNDNSFITFLLKRQLTQNYEIRLEAFDANGIKWAENSVIVQILSLSMND